MSNNSVNLSDKEDSKAIDSKAKDSKGDNSSEVSNNNSKIFSGLTTQTKILDIFSSNSNILYEVNNFLIKLQEKVFPNEPKYDLIQNLDEKKLKKRMATLLKEFDQLIKLKKYKNFDKNFYYLKRPPNLILDSIQNSNNNLSNRKHYIITFNRQRNINYNTYNINENENMNNNNKKVITERNSLNSQNNLKRNSSDSLNPTLVIKKDRLIKRFKPKNISKNKKNKLKPGNISFNINNNKKQNIIKLKEKSLNEKVKEKKDFVEQKK
jgi:hypothetical protein